MAAHNMKATWLKIFEISAAGNSDHPNELKFKGVLLLLDEPSQRPPHGSRGHRILIPKEVAKKNLDTLLGMGIDYENTLDAHNPKKKIGVIQKAWIDGNKLMCSGVIWKKDFPEAAKAIKDKTLGMSFEGSNIDVEDLEASVWKITDVCFTGAAILYKTAAAYQKTEALAASGGRAVYAAELIKMGDGGKAMAGKNGKKQHTQHTRHTVSAAGGSSGIDEQRLGRIIAKSLGTAFKPVLATISAQTAALATMSASFEDFMDEQVGVQAGSDKGGKAMRCEKHGVKGCAKCGVSAEGKKKSKSGTSSSASSKAETTSEESADSSEAAEADSEQARGSVHARGAEADSEDESEIEAEASSEEASGSEIEASADDESELESAGSSASSGAPGKLGKHANENKGRKTHVTTHVHANAHENERGSGKKYRQIIRDLRREIADLQASGKKTSKKFRKLQAQVEKAYDGVERKSMGNGNLTPMLKGLLDKGAVDVSVYASAGEKISQDEFNALLDKVPTLETRMRMALKSEATRAGILDEGYVNPVNVQ